MVIKYIATFGNGTTLFPEEWNITIKYPYIAIPEMDFRIDHMEARSESGTLVSNTGYRSMFGNLSDNEEEMQEQIKDTLEELSGERPVLNFVNKED